MDPTTTTKPKVRPELIPPHIVEDTMETALRCYLQFERYLQSHPEEARRFDERIAERRKRLGK